MSKDNGGPASDRELLVLAAKAAGLPMCDEWDCAADGDGILIGAGNGDLKPWNPLTNDGDALLLAVKLRLDISVGFSLAGELRCRAILDEGIGASEPAVDDHCAATRRAIVRAAAAIGSAM